MRNILKRLSKTLVNYLLSVKFCILRGDPRRRPRPVDNPCMLLQALGAAGAAILGAAVLSTIDMGSKRIAQSPPSTALKVLTPQIAAGSLLTGAALWSSSPLVALVLRRPG